MRSAVHRVDTVITDIITSWPSLRKFFLAITALGDPIVVGILGLSVIMCGYFQSDARLVIAGFVVWATLVFGAILKLIVGRSRPDTEYANNLQISTYSFPSGHAGGSTVAYGLLAYLVWHLLPQPWNYTGVGILSALIILIGISRIYLGAHFPSDVIAGWLLGGVALLTIVLVVRPLL